MLKNLRIAGVLILALSTPVLADDLSVVYKPSKPHEAIRQSLQASPSLQELVSALNASFKFPQGLKLVFSDEDEAAYDPSTNEILMSYAFVQDIQDVFTQAKAEVDGKPEEAAINALAYMLIHELAHAFIEKYELPVIGKEEDAADGLASVILSEYFEEGQEIVLDGAMFFDLISADRKVLTDEDFWDEHSLDEQRLYNALCYVYGSDPKKYADVKKLAGFPSERADLCIDEYAKLADSWEALLEPYMKK